MEVEVEASTTSRCRHRRDFRLCLYSNGEMCGTIRFLHGPPPPNGNHRKVLWLLLLLLLRERQQQVMRVPRREDSSNTTTIAN